MSSYSKQNRLFTDWLNEIKEPFSPAEIEQCRNNTRMKDLWHTTMSCLTQRGLPLLFAASLASHISRGTIPTSEGELLNSMIKFAHSIANLTTEKQDEIIDQMMINHKNRKANIKNLPR